MFSKFKPFEGPSDFTWIDPDTGTKFSERSKKDLIDRITAYRAQNNLEVIEYLPVVLENYWCSLPQNKGKCVSAEIDRGFLGYFRGGIALLKQMAYRRFVSQETADNRAAICLRCPHNTFPNKESFIKWSDDIAEASTLGRRSKFHSRLGQCDVCGCPNRAKVWTGERVPIHPTWVEPMRAVHCWQLSIGDIKE
jgi:ribosomal protein L37E